MVLENPPPLEVQNFMKEPPTTNKYKAIKLSLTRAYEIIVDEETPPTKRNVLFCSLPEEVPADMDEGEELAEKEMRLTTAIRKQTVGSQLKLAVLTANENKQ